MKRPPVALVTAIDCPLRSMARAGVQGCSRAPLRHRRRFSLLWSPTSQALGMALEKHADVAWPLVLGALRDAQADHLGGTGAGLAPGDQSPVVCLQLRRGGVVDINSGMQEDLS